MLCAVVYAVGAVVQAATCSVLSQRKGAVLCSGTRSEVPRVVLQALQDGDGERCGSLLAEARVGIVASLGALTPESVSTVDPAFVRLEMLRAVGEAWALKWPSRPLVPLPCLLLTGTGFKSRPLFSVMSNLFCSSFYAS